MTKALTNKTETNTLITVKKYNVKKLENVFTDRKGVEQNLDVHNWLVDQYKKNKDKKRILDLMCDNGHLKTYEFLRELISKALKEYKDIEIECSEEINSNSTIEKNNKNINSNPKPFVRSKMGEGTEVNLPKINIFSDIHIGIKTKKRSNCIKKIKKASENLKYKLTEYSTFFKKIISYQLPNRKVDLNTIKTNFVDGFYNTLANFSNDKDLYKAIKTEIDSIIETIYKTYMSFPNDFGDQSDLFEDLFTMCSNDNIKHKILNTYKEALENKEYIDVPIPLKIISAILTENLNDCNKTYRKVAIDCIKLSCLKKQDNTPMERLLQENFNAICNQNLEDEVRKYAFEWYIETDFSERNDFCWKIISELNKKDKLEQIEIEIIVKCFDFLIRNEYYNKIYDKVWSYLKSEKISIELGNFIESFHKYNGKSAIAKELGKLEERNKVDYKDSYSNIWNERNKELDNDIKLIES